MQYRLQKYKIPYSQGAGLPKYKFRSTQTTEKVWYLNMVEKDLLINVR